MRALSNFPTVVILVFVAVPSWGATVRQEVRVFYEDFSGTRQTDFDSVIAGSSADITTDILASLTPPPPTIFTGHAAAGRFGQVGLQGLILGAVTGDMFTTKVSISNDEFVNLTAQTRNARASFIIDGGTLSIDAGLGSFLEYSLDVFAVVYDAMGNLNVFSSGRFISGGRLEVVPTGTGLEFTTAGFDDIGATLSGSSVEIPLSFQTFDFGPVEPGGFVDLSYTMTMKSEVVSFAEGIVWEFSDPLDIASSTSGMPTVEFLGPVTGVIPEPTSIAIWSLLAATGIGLVHWRRK